MIFSYLNLFLFLIGEKQSKYRGDLFQKKKINLEMIQIIKKSTQIKILTKTKGKVLVNSNNCKNDWSQSCLC